MGPIVALAARHVVWMAGTIGMFFAVRPQLASLSVLVLVWLAGRPFSGLVRVGNVPSMPPRPIRNGP
jgi:hypothetical protein